MTRLLAGCWLAVVGGGVLWICYQLWPLSGVVVAMTLGVILTGWALAAITDP